MATSTKKFLDETGLSLLWGKIQGAFAPKSHILDKNNPHEVTAAQIGAVSTDTTVNGKALSSNVTLSASDIGARPADWTPSASDLGLNNVGNYKAVSTEANQGLSTTEQANARANIGAGTSTAPNDAQKNVQSDWNATSGDAFIKNKPTIPTVTDTYSSASSNAMSGKAVASAISGLPTENTITDIASTNGSGNVITSITANNGQLTLTKGITALTEISSSDSGTGAVVTGVSTSGGSVTVTKGSPKAGTNTLGLVSTSSSVSSTTGYTAAPIIDGVVYYKTDVEYTNALLGQGYGTCSTAEATAAKTVSLSNYALAIGGIVSVKFTNAVPANATLNINGKGAKAIYYDGAAIKAGIIKAGDLASFIYDGTRYQLIAIDKAKGGQTFYSSLTEINSSLNSSSDLVSIFNAMENNSKLICTLSGASTTIYPSANGTLIIEKTGTNTGYSTYIYEDGKTASGVFSN